MSSCHLCDVLIVSVVFGEHVVAVLVVFELRWLTIRVTIVPCWRMCRDFADDVEEILYPVEMISQGWIGFQKILHPFLSAMRSSSIAWSNASSRSLFAVVLRCAATMACVRASLLEYDAFEGERACCLACAYASAFSGGFCTRQCCVA